MPRLCLQPTYVLMITLSNYQIVKIAGLQFYCICVKFDENNTVLKQKQFNDIPIKLVESDFPVSSVDSVASCNFPFHWLGLAQFIKYKV